MKERLSRELNAADIASETLEDAALAADKECELDAADLLPEISPEPEVKFIAAGAMVYVPESYEPNYAYPLIVWLENSPRVPTLETRMEAISTRNYVSVAINPTCSPRGEGEPLRHAIGPAMAEVWEQFSIHEDRVYVAGIGDGATAALRVLLRHPEWFRGAICLGGSFPNTKRPLQNFRQLRGKRVLVGTESGESLASSTRLLYSAGLDVDATRATGLKLLREIDHWIMRGVPSAIV